VKPCFQVPVQITAPEAPLENRPKATAKQIFSSGEIKRRSFRSPLLGQRMPTGAEQAAAGRLARALRAAAHRERVAVTRTSPIPPGRLRMREVLAAEAQRAASKIPTAEPFIRTIRSQSPTPPLRVGIACDISSSMADWSRPVASAAWILARAVAHVPDARSATVVFGRGVHPVTYPGATPRMVRGFTADDPTEEFCKAVDALDGALDLSRAGAARLLVVVSDGRFRPDQRLGGQERVSRLLKAGCGVLWLAPGPRSNPLDGSQIVTLADPSAAAGAIGQAVIRALAAAG
jgi:hypothetical protein